MFLKKNTLLNKTNKLIGQILSCKLHTNRLQKDLTKNMKKKTYKVQHLEKGIFKIIKRKIKQS